MRDGRGRALAVAVLLAVLVGCGGDATGEPPLDADVCGGTGSGRRRGPRMAGHHAEPRGPLNSVARARQRQPDHAQRIQPGGSGDVYITFERARLGQLIPHRGQTAVTVAGCEGTYRRFVEEGRPSEEWMVDIRGDDGHRPRRRGNARRDRPSLLRPTRSSSRSASSRPPFVTASGSR